jgi:hypothetical protein
MLNKVKVGSKVILANGSSATVTRIATNWGKKSFFIKANSGVFAEREYNENGKTTKNEVGMAVTKVISGFNEENAQATMGYTAAELRALADELDAAAVAVADGSEPTEMNFGDGRGAVSATRHLNSDGTYGGYVADTAYVAEGIRVGRGSTVFGDAEITGTGRIINNSRVGISLQMKGETFDGVTLSYGKLANAA